MSRTILLMEDDPSLHYMVKTILLKAGYELLSAFAGDEGLRILHDNHPDLVLLDNMMPVKSGEEVFAEVMSNDAYADKRQIPYVMLTAKQMDSEQIKSLLGQGMAAFLQKPFGHKELLNILQNILTTHEIQAHGQRLFHAISKAKDFLSNLVDNIPDALIIVNKNGRIDFYNGGQKEILGREPESLQDQAIDDFLVTDSESFQSLMDRVQAEGTLSNVELGFIKGDGEVTPLRVSVAKLCDQEEQMIGLILIGADISEIKRLEMELVEKEKIAMFLETAIAINHEINNPLAPILGNVQLLLGDSSNLNPTICKRLEVIQRNAQRIHEITQKLGNIRRPKQTHYVGETMMVDIFDSE